jgi:hypothetical protein
MTNQRDPHDRSREQEIAISERMDKAARLIFPLVAALIIIATVAYLFGASRVEINPGKAAGYAQRL